jgi:hypothetical protein
MIERKIERFNRTFKAQFANLYQPEQRNDVNFILLNSMALENDGFFYSFVNFNNISNFNKYIRL